MTTEYFVRVDMFHIFSLVYPLYPEFASDEYSEDSSTELSAGYVQDNLPFLNSRPSPGNRNMFHVHIVR